MGYQLIMIEWARGVGSCWSRLEWLRMRWVSALLRCSVACCVAPTAAAAEPPPLQTDRPGNANAATTVPNHSLQLEASVAADSVAGALRRYSAPSLLRYGVLEKLELRVGSALLGVDTTGDTTSVEWTDASVGAKLALYASDTWQFATSADISLPTGTGAFESRYVNVDWRLLSSTPLVAGLGLLLNAGIDLPRVGDAYSPRALHVVNLSYTLPFAEAASVFAESYGRHPVDGNTSIWQVDAGLVILVAPTLQLDVFTQHGLTDASPDLIAALGVSTRFGP